MQIKIRLQTHSIHSEYTPPGWMKIQKELLQLAQRLYMRQPGYWMRYITGKYLLEQTMIEYALLNDQQGAPFSLRDFLDQLNAIDNIPISLGQWDLRGVLSRLPESAK